ncbi:MULTISPECIES: type VI secretion system baseplate subunit TssK [Salinivibrio]|uniref:Type VI secretion system baseplate subunit TssK n=1 Tax=Salinivibrio costicola TaxID=51367 RepID=A0ABX6KAJ2_SALCS|nr:MULTISPECIES: type VI secretion system baseplate subunit TssK [Salinivibrio]ODQ01406.1 type VI secretion system-associated protein [Salinivibrio sp. DV]OOF25502.1 type VI secretion system-associated protein [Salinivibrio sp. IB872]PCE65669.1 type VI secretion system-associated protein [Salinivibrio sp. YCSC6]QCF37879.1 type VI secretion system baseplate subunit TssK [Salinivibrio sp. YCSC6]QIR07470.1 type VI secretion system baseplate subunit TssK [Salinivibrio costicola]
MFARNRVIWSEGLFIKPQHFQQQQRYSEYLLEERLTSVSKYLYGVSELSLNPEYLAFGRIAIERAVGVMPDGTAFRIPQEDVMPDALEIEDSSLSNQLIYLAVPLRSESIMEVNWPDDKGSGRYESRRIDVRDVHSVQGDTTTLDVSPIHLQLMLEKEDRSAYASIPVARILEKRPDGSVVLDPDFIPCHFNVAGNATLHRFINEMAGLMHERAKNIAQRISSPSQGGVADVSDFMLLHSLNRLQPQMKHLASLGSLHPERLYECLSSVCGELATFTDESRLAPTLPAYNHDMPSESFWPVIRYLRQSLSVVLEPRAVSIQLDKRNYGLMVAPIQDPQLMDSAEFIVAVKARMPLDELRRLFTQQTKVSSVEKIRELISLQLPGIPLIPLPVAPRQLPYHAGYTYYQLDKESAAWAMLSNSSGFAFHVAAAFDDLDIQFWAIRD